MKRLIAFITFLLTVLLVSPIFASAYIYSYGDINPYGSRSLYSSGRHYGNYFSGGYGGYGGYQSSFYTGGYNQYYGTYGYYGYYPYLQRDVLDYFYRTSPLR